MYLKKVYKICVLEIGLLATKYNLHMLYALSLFGRIFIRVIFYTFFLFQ